MIFALSAMRDLIAGLVDMLQAFVANNTPAAAGHQPAGPPPPCPPPQKKARIGVVPQTPRTEPRICRFCMQRHLEWQPCAGTAWC